MSAVAIDRNRSYVFVAKVSQETAQEEPQEMNGCCKLDE